MPNYRSIRYRNAVETTREDSQFSSVLSGGGGGTTTYDDMAALVAATGMSDGDQAFVLATNNLYIYKTNGWFKIATVENLQPGSISGVDENYTLAVDGTPTVITATATDPEGFPLTWSYAVTTGSLGSTATVSQADNVFTITPSTTEADEGSFSITFSATDGVNGAVNAVSDFTLSFGWTVDLSNVTYDSVSLFLGSYESSPCGVRFKPDGTKMYITGTGSDSVQQYTLSTAFDVSTASYDSVSFSVVSQESTPRGLDFNADGTKMYITGSGSDSVQQYTLSTAFDLSTASYDSVSFSVASQDTTPRGLAFNSDGTKMYIAGQVSDAIHQYSLSTGFDVSTASYDSVSFSVASHASVPRGLAFNTDGTKMYIVGVVNQAAYQYSLSTGFDLSTASYDSVSFNIADQEPAPTDIIFSADGTKMYVMGSNTDYIYQYSTGL